jgi:hypothetical protein
MKLLQLGGIVGGTPWRSASCCLSAVILGLHFAADWTCVLTVAGPGRDAGLRRLVGSRPARAIAAGVIRRAVLVAGLVAGQPTFGEFPLSTVQPPEHRA